MIGILVAILLAALVYFLCVALGLPAIVGIVAAVLVLIAGIGTGGYGFRRDRARPLGLRARRNFRAPLRPSGGRRSGAVPHGPSTAASGSGRSVSSSGREHSVP